MRGRANDPNVQRAKSSRHATRCHYCSCGKIVRGNGGKAAHKDMHERRGEWRTKYTYITSDAFDAQFPETR